VYRRCKTLNVTEGARLANQNPCCTLPGKRRKQSVLLIYSPTLLMQELKLKGSQNQKIAFAVISSTFFVAKG
jgi:hypothetical protein